VKFCEQRISPFDEDLLSDIEEAMSIVISVLIRSQISISFFLYLRYRTAAGKISGHVSEMRAISGIYRTVIEEIINVK
jgi:hypothetical protein